MNLPDLPDEILFFILKKMNVVDTLYRQTGVHSRLDQLLFDHIYVRELDFTIKSWDDSIYPINDLVTDRICKNILPHINNKITKFILEPNAIERVLRIVNYPKLSSLSLMNFSKKKLIQYLTENSSLIKLMNEQITHLNVYIIDETDNDTDELNLLELILSLSKCLIDFTFHQSSEFRNQNLSTTELSSTICSTLTKLDIHLNTFDECLFLFDNRFPLLSHCSICIDKILLSSSSIDNKTKLLKLKYFSLTLCRGTNTYDDVIVPFLQRMVNLEELHLFLTVSRRDTFRIVDGNDLKQNILIHLSQLKTFHFSIYTYLYQFINREPNNDDYSSNNDIQQSFIDTKLGQVGSYVHHSSSKNRYRCHVYSIPYKFKTFMRLSISFTGGIFTNVRILAINDDVSWNYHFFHKVNQSFPFIETLMICNSLPQEDKSLLNNNFEQFPIVTFNQLLNLHIYGLHIDYIQQLLFNQHTRLPCLGQLEIKYEELVELTNNFTNNPLQLNCLQVQNLIINGCFVRPQNFSLFFPLL
ncbi:unnamed protein product [Adineta steineri]|uniref:F-box domain-containing protein n=1 Tax=Adineta steineri TaxID=433720 RepID=A0A814BC35_9BILA|nr:unnamed protein product [Adineta steineri]CAF3925589.1 unnamed protein product [Adineta steineri]